MKYSKSLMEDVLRWYGLEGHPEFQLERNHMTQWKAAHIRVRLPRDWKQAIATKRRN